MSGRWPYDKNGDESFDEFAERLRPERETRPDACSHCGTEGAVLTNYSRSYGGNVGAHWLCDLCEATMSASRLGAGAVDIDQTLLDVIRCLHVMRETGHPDDDRPPDVWLVWETDDMAARPSPARLSLAGAQQTKARMGKWVINADGTLDRRIARYRGVWED